MKLSIRYNHASTYLWWLSLFLIMSLAGVIRLGIIDPPPINSLIIPELTESIAILGQPITRPLTTTLPHLFSLHITIVPTNATYQATYAIGFILENSTQQVGVAVRPDGFVHVWTEADVPMPWQSWPLATIHPYISSDKPIIFELIVTEAHTAAYINQKRLWIQSTPAEPWKTIALYTDGMGNNQSITLLHEEREQTIKDRD